MNFYSLQMANNTNHLKKIFDKRKIKNNNKRESFFIYSFLIKNYQLAASNLNFNNVGTSLMDVDLNKAIDSIQNNLNFNNNNQPILDVINNVIEWSLLPIDNIKHINDMDIRTSRFVLFHINNIQIISYIFSQQPIDTMLRQKLSNDVEKILFTLDIAPITTNDKESILTNALVLFRQHDSMNRKYYEWFDHKEYMKSRCEFSLDWISKKINFQSLSFLDPTIPDAHTRLVILLDELFSNASFIPDGINNLKLRLDQMKKYWSQHHYRESLKYENKKQCNFLLSKGAADQLNQLAENHLMSKAQIIEKLIRKEMEHKIYLTEK